MTNPTTQNETMAGPELSDFISLFYAAGNRLFTLRKALARSMGLDSPQFAAVLALSRLDEGEGVRVRALADDVYVASTNMTATVNSLVRDGWARKVTDQEDSRAVRVFLTDAAKARLKEQQKVIHRINEVWFAGATSEQIRQARFVLAVLIRNYEQTAAIANSVDTTTLEDLLES